ncbi:hypothetical protein SVI_1016 [Shewanella violacea DSS12]|uniref:Uncharacterized protein n=1 Tax=Shewanella violacea (strain JCM 10179 / CIP 106290 / LMG 19151 / DSS12) TaxID=637905 RepID=D4ZH38_SHEVD|nr:hypothetical protein SVI_1016 [Shewanella violacea DSS12]
MLVKMSVHLLNSGLQRTLFHLLAPIVRTFTLISNLQM